MTALACAADQVIADAGGPAWDADGFARLVAQARDALPLATARVVDVAAQVLEAAHEAEVRLQRAASPALAAALADARGQFAALIYPRFVSETGLRRLPDLVRYLRAISRRLDTAAQDPGRDAGRMAAVREVTEAYQQAVAELPAARRSGAGRPGGALDDRGTAGQPLRPGAGHVGAGVGEADPRRA